MASSQVEIPARTMTIAAREVEIPARSIEVAGDNGEMQTIELKAQRVTIPAREVELPAKMIDTSGNASPMNGSYAQRALSPGKSHVVMSDAYGSTRYF